MFDNLRENFEVVLMGLLAVSAISYFIYRCTFFRDIKYDLSSNDETLSGLPRKERKKLKANITTRHLNTFSRKSIFFFADLFWVLLFVVVLRSFFYEPFIIPSSSMKPGLQIGDVVLVNKYEKGLRMPVTNARLTSGSTIERGDVLVFKYPMDPAKSYIKRVIGLPGDKVSFDGRNLTINGTAVSKTFDQELTNKISAWSSSDNTSPNKNLIFNAYEEHLPGRTHSIQYAKQLDERRSYRVWSVPADKYLVFGDNRDNSADSRVWGFVDDSLIVGHAKRIALNVECFKGNGMCDRFFKTID